MKKQTKFFAIAIVMLAFSAATFAQQTGVSATAKTTATIVNPIGIAWAGDLNFGNIAVLAGQGGTATISTTGVRSQTLGVTLPAGSQAGTVTAAHFDVTGEIGFTYSIQITGSPVTISLGSDNMTVDNFTSTPTEASGGTLDGSGKQTIDVGATLNVNPGQAVGTYTSSSDFGVTVNYN
jgi:hypothetical protein